MSEKLTSVSILQRLVQKGRYSGDEKDTADELKAIFEELNYDEIATMPCGSVVGLIGPKDAPVKVLFDGHIDIATVTGEWKEDPFSGSIHDGKVWGRGTSDQKGGLAAAAYAAAEYAKTHEMKYRVAVSGTVMEETKEGLGVEELCDLYQPENVVITEPSYCAVMVGQKGRVEIELTIIGKSAHASNPEVGINSVVLASKAILALDAVEPPVHELLGTGILVVTDITTEPYPLISFVPDRTKIRFDRRSLPGETEEDILNGIHKVLKETGIENYKLEVTQSTLTTYPGKEYTRKTFCPSWSLDTSSPLFLAMQNAARTELETEPEVSTWICCTNGSEFAGTRKIPTVGLGPGLLSQAHTVDESIEVDQMEKATKIYEEFLKEYLQ